MLDKKLRAAWYTLCLCFSVACAQRGEGDKPPLENELEAPNPTTFSYRDETTEPPSPRAKIFLVAGGSDNANFAEEVIRQKQIWQDRGFVEEEISCYYAMPTPEGFEKDHQQYAALVRPLQKCFPATPRILLGHLRAAGSQAIEFLYLYVTSHGAPPLSEQQKRLPWYQRHPANQITQWIAEFPVLDRTTIGLEVFPGGEIATPSARVEALFEHKYTQDELFFTPHSLRSALTREAESIPKYIALQACYSGGFISGETKERRQEAIAQVPNTTVLTASRHDRSSFGCESGLDQTYFGETYNTLLDERLTHPLDMDWTALQSELATRIEDLETQRGAQPPSLPQFSSNRPSVREMLRRL